LPYGFSSHGQAHRFLAQGKGSDVTSTGDVGRVLGRIGGGLFQQAYVVTDRERAKESMRTSFGCDRFVEFEMDVTWQFRGEPVKCALSLAFARSGNTQIEIMEPISGVGVHHEFLAHYGPGLHHLGFLVDHLDDVAAEAAREGFPTVMSALFGQVRLGYLDTLDALGFYLELIEDPTGSLAAMMPWRDSQ
jgi:methylmalonyl-CoA/ethylmalonyl-CoA epimerase